MPSDSMKRGQRKMVYIAHMRLDPTNDMFLKTEEREGGPMTSFEDNVKLLFAGIQCIHIFLNSRRK